MKTPKTTVDLPGGVRTDFPDGSYLVEGQSGEKFVVSESGSITGTMPEIRQVQIEDLSLVLTHQIAHTQDTTSHTLHFVGGGVFSYLHYRNGRGMSFHSTRIRYRTRSGGVVIVCGTAPDEMASPS